MLTSSIVIFLEMEYVHSFSIAWIMSFFVSDSLQSNSNTQLSKKGEDTITGEC